MTEQQIFTFVLAMAPTLLTVRVGILINNARLRDPRSHLAHRFDVVDRRFVEKSDLWRSEQHPVQEVLDARWEHREER
jgi:hypothetical protein